MTTGIPATSFRGESTSRSLAPIPNLDRLFHPASIAIIGASARTDSISGLPQRILAQHQYEGRVYPVNPRYQEIDGAVCYSSVGSVPGVVDVALIVVNADRVASVLTDCGNAGVRFAIVISSGFAEEYDAADRQQELERVRRAYPLLRILGPNTEGLINVADDIPLGFSPTIDYTRGLQRLRAGRVAVVSQSGGLGFALFNNGLARGLGFSHVISTGNELDLDLADIGEYLLSDSSTDILMLFIEGLTPPRKLADVAAIAKLHGKDLIVAKVGSSPAGRRAAAAHTAHDTGDDAEYQAIIEQFGILRARDQVEMGDFAMALSRTLRPRGPRVGVVTVSGGSGAWAADALTDVGLEVPLLSEGVQARLRQLIPAYGSPANPVDATAQILTSGGVAPALNILVESGEVDTILLASTLADPAQLARERDGLADIAQRVPLVIYSYTTPGAQTIELLAELGIAYYPTSTGAAAAIRALLSP